MRDYRLYLKDILAAIESIDSFVAGMDLESFQSDDKTSSAVMRKFEIIGDVRGLGPMLAIELVRDRETKKPAAEEASALVKYCVDHGVVVLICGTFNNVLRFLPPLVITDEELDKGLSVIEEGLASLRKK